MKRLGLVTRGSFAGAVLLISAWGNTAEPGDKGVAHQKAQMTVKAFDDVEPLRFDWGWIRWLMNSKIDPNAEMTFGVVYIRPHQQNPIHLHPNSGEYLHVIEGSLEHMVGDKWVTMKAGDTIRIPQNVPHCARTRDQACRAVIVYNTGDRRIVHVDDQ